jgi:hypothetical protein
MRTKNSLIFEIGLFVKSADGKKATCIECKQNNRPKYEFELPRNSTKSVTCHLESGLHKDSDYFKKYKQLIDEFEAKGGQPKITNMIPPKPSGFTFNR